MFCHFTTASSFRCLHLCCFGQRAHHKVASPVVNHFHNRQAVKSGCCYGQRRLKDWHASCFEAGRSHRTLLSTYAGSTPLRLVSPGKKHVINLASRSKLDMVDVPLLFGGSSVRDVLGRAVCEAGCLPRKEFFEAWEVGRRVHEHFRPLMAEMAEDVTVVDLAAGHGMLAWVLLALEPRLRLALCIDKCKPASAGKLEVALLRAFPRLAGRLRYAEGDMAALCPHARTLLVSVHACGSLTDAVLDLALRGRAPVAVVPCCHVLDGEKAGGLRGWLDGALAMDVERAARLKAAGYLIDTQLIPEEVTPKNRLLLGLPQPPEPPCVACLLSEPEERGTRDVGDIRRSLHPPLWRATALPDSPWTKFRTNYS